MTEIEEIVALAQQVKAGKARSLVQAADEFAGFIIAYAPSLDAGNRMLQTVETWLAKHADAPNAATMLLAFMKGDCQHDFTDVNFCCELCGVCRAF